jgi:transcription antitermination protein NusB
MNPDSPIAPSAAPLPPRPRSIARTAAVQALYQMDLAGTDINAVIQEFQHVRFEPSVVSADEVSDDDLDEKAEGADPQFFADILKGVVRRQLDIDPMIDLQLADGWRLVRVDSILRAILRAGAFELLERTDVPARVVINEYINVAKAFFDAEEPRVVNGVLDRIAHKLRSAELAKTARKQDR